MGARVGLIEAKGAIGEGQTGIDADKIVRLLKKYEKDDDIKAIVLRVDSPGGSVAPSQEIHDAIKRIKARKKVVVSTTITVFDVPSVISAIRTRLLR